MVITVNRGQFWLVGGVVYTYGQEHEPLHLHKVHRGSEEWEVPFQKSEEEVDYDPDAKGHKQQMIEHLVRPLRVSGTPLLCAITDDSRWETYYAFGPWSDLDFEIDYNVMRSLLFPAPVEVRLAMAAVLAKEIMAKEGNEPEVSEAIKVINASVFYQKASGAVVRDAADLCGNFIASIGSSDQVKKILAEHSSLRASATY